MDSKTLRRLVADTLRRTHRRLTTGWTQGAFQSYETGRLCRCLVGAARVSASEARDRYNLHRKPSMGPAAMFETIYHATLKALARQIAPSSGLACESWEGTCIQYNDAPGRTVEEVLRVVQGARDRVVAS